MPRFLVAPVRPSSGWVVLRWMLKPRSWTITTESWLKAWSEAVVPKVCCCRHVWGRNRSQIFYSLLWKLRSSPLQLEWNLGFLFRSQVRGHVHQMQQPVKRNRLPQLPSKHRQQKTWKANKQQYLKDESSVILHATLQKSWSCYPSIIQPKLFLKHTQWIFSVLQCFCSLRLGTTTNELFSIPTAGEEDEGARRVGRIGNYDWRHHHSPSAPIPDLQWRKQTHTLSLWRV